MIMQDLLNEIDLAPNKKLYGMVQAISGNVIYISGMVEQVMIGERCRILRQDGGDVICEIIGFEDNLSLALPFDNIEGISSGNRVEASGMRAIIYPDTSWLGRVVNAFGAPIDEKGTLKRGDTPYYVRADAPNPHQRKRVGERIDLGVRGINNFTTCCRGQRMGVFAGSGVGKSKLLSMITRFCDADVVVLALVGERGRELQEFIHRDLGDEGLKRCVIVAASSHESAMLRRECAYSAMTICEYFRDQGMQVMLLMDSVTRFAMAQREIGLAGKEPPTTKGYPPTVFAQLPKLLERAGPGLNKAPSLLKTNHKNQQSGDITLIATVLVEGDDHNEPIADAVRGILDGHIVLSRDIAHRNRFPAIDILRSISRTMPDCNSAEETIIINEARRLLAAYENMEELIKLGAYRHGSDALVDQAIYYYPQLDHFIAQESDDFTSIHDGFQILARIFSLPEHQDTSHQHNDDDQR